ncbi:hypothetical protein [Wolbachia endosymbiont of Psylliodes chrysocephala]|uniref:hypothetical protein n=1 Tax=Wolbachia endosymbiont of Psylliodes chrysocephala TaxID=2883236 RepID=UPI0020A161E7|nr:hypothetical protein [Wolbachia endosymbiont of Psylliodes chrysocephala]
MMSFQRVTLESSSYCTFTWCRVKFPGSQCLGTGMTGEGGYLDDKKEATFMTLS